MLGTSVSDTHCDIMNLCSIQEIQRLLKPQGFKFSKNMGQNFLIESWVPQQTAEASGAASGYGVLEIGPGIGPLTTELAKLADKVAAVELDQRLYSVLDYTLADFDNTEIIPGDIMKFNIAELCRDKFPGLRVLACANLPYNITTPVITAMLEAECFEAVTVMIQKEVALRICAAPGTSEYGAFTLLCQYYADTELLYDVPPTCFYPAPKVMSSVIRMKVRGCPPEEVQDKEFFFKVVRGAFALRRKTLLNSLSTIAPKENVRQAIIASGLPENIRGERLSFHDFVKLSQKLKDSFSLT